MDPIAILAIIIALLYIAFYLNGKRILKEGYKNTVSEEEERNCKTVLDTSLTSSKPYVTNEDKYGDFEGDFIYQNEGGPDPTRDAMNNARRRFPFDWAQLPPSSSLFQAQQALFVKDPTSTAAPFNAETFTNIESKKVLPPEEYEQDALKAYQAKLASDMKSVDGESVNKLIQDIYGQKGFIAKVAEKANNVYEVYELVEKDPKIEWEDDVQQASIQSNDLNPIINTKDALIVPNTVQDIHLGVTPKVAGESMGLKRQSYDNYNPNLEGIFGPKMQMQQWG